MPVTGESGGSVRECKTDQECPFGKGYTPDRVVAIGLSWNLTSPNDGELRSVQAELGQRLVHRHAGDHGAINRLAACGVSSVGDPRCISVGGGVHRILNDVRRRGPADVGWDGIAAVTST